MKTGSFETDTKRAEKALEDLKKRAATVGTAVGVGLAAAAAGAYAAFEHFAGAAAEFKDLEEQTGATAEELASLSVVAQVAGTSVADMAGQMNKLTKNLSGVDDESKAAGAALSALGIPIEEFKKLNPVEQIDALSKAFNGFADGSQKTAVALALFGKSGASMLNVFKELESSGGRQVILTQQQIELADDYKDKQARLNATLKAYAASAATDVLPALNDLTAAGKEVFAELAGIDASGKKLATESPIKEFAQGAVDVLAFVVDAGQGVARVFQTIGKVIAAESAALNALTHGDVQAAKNIAIEAQADIDKLLSAELFSQRIARIRQAAQEAAKPDPNQSDAETRRLGRRPQLEFNGAAKKDKAAGDKQTEADRYLEALQKQVEGVEHLSAQEKALAEIQSGRLKGITPQVEVQILQTAQLLDYEKQLKELRDGEVQTNTNIGKAQLAEADAIAKQNMALRDEIDAIGLSKEELAARELQLVRVTRAEKQSTLAKKEAAGVDETQLQVLQQEIDLLTEREQLLTQKADRTAEEAGKEFAQKAADKTRDVLGDQIEAGILDGFRKGESLTDIFLRELKAQFAKTILRPLIQPIVDAQNSGIGSILGSIAGLFGSFSGSPITAGDSPLSGTGDMIRGRHAGGGTEHAGGAYLVGEKGPEVFRPSTSGRMLPNGVLGGPRPVTVQVTNNGSPVSARSTTQETDTGTLVKIMLNAVGADVAGGTGPVSRGLKARGVNLNNSLPVRG